MKEFDYEAAKAGAKVQTRDGRPARIICWDKKDPDYPIVVLSDDDGREWVDTYSRNGEFGIGEISSLDLVMAPTKKEGWVNVCQSIFYGGYFCGHIFSSKEEADMDKGNDRIACVHIEWEE